MFRRGLMLYVICWLTAYSAASAEAEDRFFGVNLTNLKLTDGERPNYQQVNRDWMVRQRLWQILPEVQLDEAGEAYLRQTGTWEINSVWFRIERGSLAIRVPEKREVTGRLLLPKSDGSGLRALKFRIPADAASVDSARAFQLAKIEHYERRLRVANPGAAWYRSQVEIARQALGKLSQEEDQQLRLISGGQRWNERQAELDRTYEMFSGGRAISENLQLDRELLLLRRNSDDAKPVALDSIKGITVKEIDWQPLIKDAQPKLDALASAIPADQHVVFLPTFAAAMKVADEAKLQGTNALRHTELSSQDTHLVERYERQLGLSLSTLGRLIGPKVVSSMAVTGGDAYFATGTDVAVLFETAQPPVLAALLLAKIRLDAAATRDAKSTSGEVDGLKYQAIRSPDRSVCSYIAELDRAVVVTNSPAQLQRLAAVRTGEAESIAKLPEYVFFRQRYSLGDASESALLFISDATIRRWCGPKWRIGSSRRTRDAAVLAHLQASQLDALVTGKDLKPGPITSELPFSLTATVELTTSGVTSPELGRPDFLTPISELSFETVSVAEKSAYERWRDGYQNNWTMGFDPIALRVGSDEKRLSADLSIMPLITRSEYREMLQVATGVKLDPDAGDPHDTLAHFVLALNRESRPIQQWNRILKSILDLGQVPGAGAKILSDPLGWLGESFAIYADRDPYWVELQKLAPAERERKLQHDGYPLPFAIRIAVRQPLKLALFLTGVRSLIQQSAPGLTHWDTLTHREHQYVKIWFVHGDLTREQKFEDAALFYTTVGDGLVLTPNEEVLKRAIDRQLDRDAAAALTVDATKLADAKALADRAAWLGESAALTFEQSVPTSLLWFFDGGTESRETAQIRSWSNLPILNEWRRRYPDHDPIEVHRRFWGVELVCPSGGKYVWNEEWRTMESTVFGHPGEPKLPDLAAAPLFPFTHCRFGITFELDGLRSRLELERETK